MVDSHVLIVEDEPLIAMDLEATTLAAGARAVTVCGSLAEARAQDVGGFAFALLDIDLTDGKSFEIARALKERRVAFTFVSAARRADLPGDLADAPFISKPFSATAIRTVVRSGLGLD